MANKTWNDTSGGWNSGTLWTPTGVPGATDSATLASAAAYIVPIGSLGATLDTVGTLLVDDPSAVLEVEDGSTLAVTSTLGLTAGTLELLNGTLAGATLLLNGGSFVDQGATFSGVTIDGSLPAGSSGTYLDVKGGLGFTSPGGGPGTLTLADFGGVSFLDSETLNNALILAPPDFGSIVETGTSALTLGSTATLEVTSSIQIDGSFVNQGTISVAANASLLIGGQFSNAGKLLLAPGSIIELTDGAPIPASELMALASTASAQGASIEFSGTLNNAGNIFSFSSASLSALIFNGSTIVGGTLVAPSADFPVALSASGVTLDGVTVLGGLTLGGEGLSLFGSPVFETASGGISGAIILESSLAPLNVDDSETLNNVTISVGASADGTDHLYLNGTSDTIGANALLSVAPALQPYSYYTYVNGLQVNATTLFNQGTIAVGQSGGGFIDITATSFANSGTLAIGAQGTLIDQARNFTDTGPITLAAGGLFEISEALTTAQLTSLASHITGAGTIELLDTLNNTGSIEIGSTDSLVIGIAVSAGTLSVSAPGTISVANGGTVVIGGLATTAQLATFLNGLTSQGSLTVVLDGTLVNTGSSLTVGNGQTVTDLVLDGDIIGGTIATAPGGTVAAAGGTLSGVTFFGPLDVSNADTSILISNGITLDTTSGAAGGTLLVTGAADEIYSLTSLALPSGTVDLFGATDVFGQQLSALTLGNGVVVNDAGDDALAANTLVNTGSLVVAAGADLSLEAASLNNSGMVSVAAGGVLDVASDLAGGQTFALSNTGVFALSPSSTLILGADDFGAFGALTAAELAALTSGNTAISVLIQQGTLLNSGAILSVGSAAAIATLDLGETYAYDQGFYAEEYPTDIIGGTIATGAGGLINVNATLTGVTFQGPLNLNLTATALTLTGGFTLETASGGADGTLFTSGDDQLDLLDGEALNNAVLIVSDETLDIATGSLASGTLPLLFGPGLTATVTDGLTLQGSSFSNAGAISLTPQTEAALSIDAPGIVNTGIISIGAFDTLSIDTGGAAGLVSFSPGQFSVAAGGTIVLGGTYTPAVLASVAAIGGPAVQVMLEGTLLNGGNNLVAAGSLDNLVLDAAIEGGTISVASGTVAVAGGTLANVVYQGSLVLAADADLAVVGSLTLQSTAGGAPGSLVVGSDNDNVVDYLNANATLDNTVLKDAGGSVTFYATNSLGLGSGLSFANSGDVSFTAATLNNAGELSAAGANSSVLLDASTLVNTGDIAITAGGELSLVDPGTSALTLVNTIGQISLATGTTLSVVDEATTAQLLSLVDGMVGNEAVFTALGGSLNNAGAILPLSGVLDDVELAGTISGGTVAAGSGSVTIGADLALVGVTYEGPLTLSDPTALAIYGGLSLTGASGRGNGTLDVTGSDDSIVCEDSSDVLANDLLLAGQDTSLSGNNVTLAASSSAVVSGTAVISGGTFSNAGAISVTGSLGIETTSFANTGAISVASGASLQLGAPGTGTGLDVSPVGAITLAGGSTIKLGGIATTSQLLALLGSIGDAGARVVLDGEVINTGTSLAVATGGLLADLLINADVVGGSIVVGNGSLAIGTTATFTGVTVDGPLNLKTDSDLTVSGSLTVVPNSGTLGRINFNGSLGIIDFLGVQTLDNVLVSANAADETIDGATLTFGPGLTLVVGASASTTIEATTFVNDGTIVSSGSLLTLDASSIDNAGVISVGAGDVLAINLEGYPSGSLQNSGSFVLAAGATLDVGGDLTTGQLASLLNTVVGTQAGVVVELSGAVSNNVISSGTLIDAVAGGLFGDLILDAEITGGTIAQGSGLISVAGGAFDGVTYQGPLVLAGSAALSIEHGITLENAAGSQPGNITVTGTNNVLTIDDAAVLANAGLNVSGSNFAIEGPSTGTLTFAASLIPSITGQLIASAGALVNATNVSLTSAGSAFELDANNVFNSGTITAAAQTVFGIGATDDDSETQSTINLFNTGVIALAAGVTLAIGGKESDAEITALVGSLAPAAGEVILDGIVINSGSTLTVPASGSLLLDNAEVVGGTIVPAGGSLRFGGSDIVQDVTYAGPLSLGGSTASELILEGGLAVVSPTGGAESISLGGTDTLLLLEDPTQTVTLNGLVVSIGSAGAIDDTLSVDGVLINPAGQTITMAGTGSALTTGEAYDSTIVNQGSIATTGTAILGGTQPGSQVVNAGVIAVTSGSLTVEGGFSNSGRVSLNGAAALDFVGGPLAAGTIDVSVGGETVAFNGTVAPGGVFTADLTGFDNADVFDLRGIVDSGVSASLVNGTLEVTQGSSLIADLILGGSAAYTQSDFAVQEDASGDAEIVSSAPCFCAGTMILTGNGPRPVETLAVGDRVVTQSGALQPIVWIGQRRVDLRRHRQPERMRPVRIKAGAFAPGLPQRDLRVSPDHAIFVDGVLIPARYLVNGATVVDETGCTAAHYFHVELAAHDVLLAEGLPAESYLDTGNRDQFADAPVTALHPDFAPRFWADACAPLCLTGPVLRTVRRGLLARAEALGYRRQAREVWLQLGTRRVRAVSVRGDVHSFVLPEGTASARVVSAAGVPAELDPQATDRRKLGVAIAGVVANGRSLALDGPVIGAGFHALEHGWRWTDGDGVLELARAGVSGKIVLALRVTGFAEAWEESMFFFEKKNQKTFIPRVSVKSG